MADIEITAEDPDKDLKETLEKSPGHIFVTNQQIEDGEAKLARLIILLKAKREANPDALFFVKELSTGVLVSWGTMQHSHNSSKKRAPEA